MQTEGQAPVRGQNQGDLAARPAPCAVTITDATTGPTASPRSGPESSPNGILSAPGPGCPGIAKNVPEGRFHPGTIFPQATSRNWVARPGPKQDTPSPGRKVLTLPLPKGDTEAEGVGAQALHGAARGHGDPRTWGPEGTGARRHLCAHRAATSWAERHTHSRTLAGCQCHSPKSGTGSPCPTRAGDTVPPTQARTAPHF